MFAEFESHIGKVVTLSAVYITVHKMSQLRIFHIFNIELTAAKNENF